MTNYIDALIYVIILAAVIPVIIFLILTVTRFLEKKMNYSQSQIRKEEESSSVHYEVFRKKAEESYEKGDFRQSLEDLLQAQLYNPEDPFLKFLFARTYLKAGDFNRANEFFYDVYNLFSRKSKLESGERDCLYETALFFIQSGKNEESGRIIRILTDAGDFRVDSLSQQLKKMEEKLKFRVEEVVEERKETVRSSDAIERCSQILQKHPQDMKARREIADEYSFRGQFEEAFRHYQKLLGNENESCENYLSAVRCLYKLGRRAEAQNLLENAEYIFKENPGMREQAVLFFLETGDTDMALKHYAGLKNIKTPEAAAALERIWKSKFGHLLHGI